MARAINALQSPVEQLVRPRGDANAAASPTRRRTAVAGWSAQPATIGADGAR